MKINTGTFAGTLASLSAANEGQTLVLYTNTNGNLNTVFKFPAAGLSSGLTISTTLRQYTASNTFNFQVLTNLGSWVKVGSSTGTTAYSSLSMTLPTGAVVNNTVSIRLISSLGSDDLVLDQLLLADRGTTPAPVPAPIPAPVPPASTSGLSIPAGTKYALQLQGTINQTIPAKVYDIDMYDNSAQLFASLKQSGRTVICYFSAGSYENWRTDANLFPAAALGNNLSGWPGERWLDVRNAAVRTIMTQRMDLAKSKGCDGIDPDNVDGYSNNTGFPLTMQDQINYNIFLADAAHARGLVVGLKNSTDLVTALVDKFDFSVVEECFKYNECSAYTPFTAKNKAVFNAEYSSYSSSICTQAASMQFSTVFYNLNLDGTVYNPCP